MVSESLFGEQGADVQGDGAFILVGRILEAHPHEAPRKIIVHIATSADGFIPRPKGHYGVLDGLFDSTVSSEDVIRRIKEKFGKRWKTSYVQTYMRKFMEAGVIHAVKPVGHKGNYWVLQA